MQSNDIKTNLILQGPLFPEPVKVIAVNPMGDSLKVIGSMQSGRVHQSIVEEDQLSQLLVSFEEISF